jgi:hypothetical protein
MSRQNWGDEAETVDDSCLPHAASMPFDLASVTKLNSHQNVVTPGHLAFRRLPEAPVDLTLIRDFLWPVAVGR